MLLFVLGHLNSYHSCSRMFASTRISSLVNNTACFNNKKLSLLHSNRSRFGPWKNSMTTFLLNLIYVGIIRYLIKRIFIQLDDDVTYDWNEFTSSIFSIQVGLSFFLYKYSVYYIKKVDWLKQATKHLYNSFSSSKLSEWPLSSCLYPLYTHFIYIAFSYAMIIWYCDLLMIWRVGVFW